jgi:O-antigen ligase
MIRYAALSSDRRGAAMAGLTTLGLMAALLAAFAGSDITVSWIARQFDDVTFTNRREIWELVSFAISRRPILGHGFGSFWQADPVENPFGRMMQLHVLQTWVNEADHINQAHNGYLDLLLNTGTVGLVLALAAVWLTLGRLVRMMREAAPGSPDRSGLFAAHSLVVWVLLNNVMESTLFYAPVYSLGVVLVIVLVQTDAWRANRQPTIRSDPRVS